MITGRPYALTATRRKWYFERNARQLMSWITNKYQNAYKTNCFDHLYAYRCAYVCDSCETHTIASTYFTAQGTIVTMSEFLPFTLGHRPPALPVRTVCPMRPGGCVFRALPLRETYYTVYDRDLTWPLITLTAEQYDRYPDGDPHLF